MNVTHKFTTDLQTRGITERIHAMQSDANTRVVEVTLLSGGEAWQVPAGVAASVSFCNLTDGNKGWYDKLPDGSEACSIDGNVVTAILAPAVLSAAGEVRAAIVFQDENLNQLATFGFSILVEKNPAAGSTAGNSYYAYSTMEEVNAALAMTGAAVVCEASGEAVTVSDASAKALQGLTLYGKTTQDGTPTPDAPIDLVSAGDGGSIGVSITDGTEDNVQTLSLSTPNGLPGISVSSGGNYTDASGQQWVCDEIDLAKGVYVQRVGKLTVTAVGQVGTHTSGTKYGAIAVSGVQANIPLRSTRYIGTSWTDKNNRAYATVGNIIINDNRFTSTAEANAILATEMPEFIYKLATPVETPLDAETLAAYAALHSNKPNTTVTNDAGAGQKISYVADTKLYIDNKFTEVTNAIVAMGGTI